MAGKMLMMAFCVVTHDLYVDTNVSSSSGHFSTHGVITQKSNTHIRLNVILLFKRNIRISNRNNFV